MAPQPEYKSNKVIPDPWNLWTCEDSPIAELMPSVVLFKPISLEIVEDSSLSVLEFSEVIEAKIIDY